MCKINLAHCLIYLNVNIIKVNHLAYVFNADLAKKPKLSTLCPMANALNTSESTVAD
ncbi:hypothetical protein GCM10025855_16900 [Shewanella glacialipiscicola]|uniref:Uncharacterized protein n=1 Tax=Shewanella glacialipiscicola TaxID=614069 RepID=A0ABQ6J5F0_9GAMM|nr:hypothetical protein GCM10025855_16900 [Shewanella glacialipiscicola]